jgi:hypothetical protein
MSLLSDSYLFEQQRLMLCHHTLAGDVFSGSNLWGRLTTCSSYPCRSIICINAVDSSEPPGCALIADMVVVNLALFDRWEWCVGSLKAE